MYFVSTHNGLVYHAAERDALLGGQTEEPAAAHEYGALGAVDEQPGRHERGEDQGQDARQRDAEHDDR
jgi:hypothetical protein